MMTFLKVVFWLVSFAAPVDEIESLRASAPAYLDTKSATEHLTAAKLAASRYRVDYRLILAIAHHESRYAYAATTPEAGGKVSCGVMTPEPTYDHAACSTATSSILNGYLAGAAHLRGWMNATSSRKDALLGYAGGNRLIAACKLGPVLRERDGLDLCQTPDVFEARAKLIRARPSS